MPRESCAKELLLAFVIDLAIAVSIQRHAILRY